MIKKKQTTPRIILSHEAALVRLEANHTEVPEIQEKLSLWKAGFSGEKSMSYPLSLLNDKEYYIFHNLRLFNGINYFQIDILLATLKLLTILEIKNWKGTVLFDGEFKQVVRTINGTETGLMNPLTQAHLHQVQLTNWLQNNNFPSIPIQYLVVFSNASTIIKSVKYSNIVSNHVLHSYNVPIKLKEISNKYTKEVFTKSDIRRLTKVFLKSHEENNESFIERNHINIHDLKRGICCSVCNSFQLSKKYNFWYCHSCNSKVVDAHIHSVKHYALLVRDTFSIGEIAYFLNVSRQSAYRMVKSMNLKAYKNGRKLIYHFPLD